MTVTALLAFTLRPESLPGAHDVVHDVLAATRAFDGCLGVDVLVDVEDPTRLVALERWASAEHDAAYRAWRATPEGASALSTVIAAPPVLTRFTTAEGV